MNYRHAFHAGNHADVLKHLVLTRVLAHLLLKDKPFRALDAFAGLGLYDLDGDEAGRTGEWHGGWGRMAAPFAAPVEALLAPYRAAVAAVRAQHGGTVYPGSPALIREALRAGDRGVFVELHPDDVATLRARFGRDARTKVLNLDGWTAVNAQIPPPERRGLVLIDPPYEVPGEIERLGASISRAVAKWPTGIVMAWYPIKDAAAVDRIAAGLDAGLGRPALRLELLIGRPDDPAGPKRAPTPAGRRGARQDPEPEACPVATRSGTALAGSGLIVVNPPWTLEAEALLFLPALAERLARGGFGAFRCATIGRYAEGR